MSLYAKKQEQEIVALQTQILELRKQSSKIWDQVDSQRCEVAILMGKKAKIILYGGYYLAFVLWLLFYLGVFKFGELFSRNLVTLSFFISVSIVLVIPLITIKLMITSYESKIMKWSQPINSLLDQNREIYINLFEKETRIQHLELLIKENNSNRQKR